MFLKKAHSGFTLIEVVLSMVVVSFALVAFVMSMITLIRHARFDEKTLEAINVVEFYQNQAQGLHRSDCKDESDVFVQFLCSDETQFAIHLNHHPMHPWIVGELAVTKSKHQELTQLNYEVKQKVVLLRSQQWIMLP